MHSYRWKTLGVTAALVLLIGACTDPTVAPKSSVTGANFFNDPASYQEFLATIYRGLAVGGIVGGDGIETGSDPSSDIQFINGGFGQYVRQLWQLQELPTDEAVIAWGDQSLPEMNTQGWNASNQFVNAMYYRVFFQVAQANEFLRETTDGVLASRGISSSAPLYATIQTYRAEARFLRALSYMHGIDFFGNIPLVTENDGIGATPPKQAARATIYNYLVSELTAIEGSLPSPGASTYGRATGPAAHMLLAELYLNAGVYTGTPNYTGAVTEATTVINSGYSLAANYFYNFDADNNTSPEMIFAVPEDGIHTQTYGSTNFIIHASCGNNLSNSTLGVDGCWYGIRLKSSAYNLFQAGDGRGAVADTSGQTVAVASLSAFGNGILYPKYTNKTHLGATGSNIAFADTDFPIFRLGEAYLIYAEGNLRGGGGTRVQALAYVNALRARAFGDTLHQTPDSLFTLQSLLDERGRELMWEAKRRTDLIRYGLFTGGTYLWAWKGANAYSLPPDSTPHATLASRDLYPLPANELIANPNLHQNPGY